MDEAADALDTAAASQAAGGGLGDALDVARGRDRGCGLRPLRPGPPLGAPFWVEQGGDDSFRSSQGWLWTDLDEYASDAHCMHTARAVSSKK